MGFRDSYNGQYANKQQYAMLVELLMPSQYFMLLRSDRLKGDVWIFHFSELMLL